MLDLSRSAAVSRNGHPAVDSMAAPSALLSASGASGCCAVAMCCSRLSSRVCLLCIRCCYASGAADQTSGVHLCTPARVMLRHVALQVALAMRHGQVLLAWTLDPTAELALWTASTATPCLVLDCPHQVHHATGLVQRCTGKLTSQHPGTHSSSLSPWTAAVSQHPSYKPEPDKQGICA